MNEMISSHFSHLKNFSKRVSNLVDKRVKAMENDHRKKADKCDFPVIERASDER